MRYVGNAKLKPHARKKVHNEREGKVLKMSKTITRQAELLRLRGVITAKAAGSGRTGTAGM